MVVTILGQPQDIEEPKAYLLKRIEIARSDSFEQREQALDEMEQLINAHFFWLDALISAAKEVIAKWEHGDLAEAVTELGRLLK